MTVSAPEPLNPTPRPEHKLERTCSEQRCVRRLPGLMTKITLAKALRDHE